MSTIMRSALQGLPQPVPTASVPAPIRAQRIAAGRAKLGGSRQVVAYTYSKGPEDDGRQQAKVVVAERDGSDDINSTAYLQDVANLSVDLDSSEDEVNVPAGSRYRTPLTPSGNPSDYTRRAAGSSFAQNAALAEAARREVQGMVPPKVLAERHHWMIVTVPEKPVAGEELVIFFNRNASDILRYRPRVNLNYGFNDWGLMPESQIDVPFVSAGVESKDGSDFLMAKIRIPKDTYELNFVLNDGEGCFENNNMQDFMYPVVGGITRDEWLDRAAERKAEAAAAQLAYEQAAAELAEKERQATALQQDKERGVQMAAEMRTNYENLRSGGATKWDVFGDPTKPLWMVSPAAPVAGAKVKLYYNRLSGPMNFFDIPQDQVLQLKFGFNGWQMPGGVNMVREPKSKIAGQEWWSAEIDVPFQAAAVNFAIGYYEHFDNNGGVDHKILVGLPAGETFDSWIGQLSDVFFKQVYEARIANEAFWKRKEQSRLTAKREAQAMVKEVERRKVRHVLYTEPSVVMAGKEVTLFYNPRDTPLNGREKVFLRGGWNRWNHPRSFGPLQMTKTPEGLFKATVKAPADAFKMDFVFSDVESGDGTYDTRGGFDYHLPVEGSAVKEPSLYIAHISVEMAPIAKVGGLGDVVVALGRAVKEQGHHVEVILPKYQFFDASPILSNNMRYETEFDWGGTKIYVLTAVVEDVRCFFIEPKNGFFNTPTVYGRYDDEVRFDFFCKAALEFLLRTGRQPDILHCHDWSTAHVAKTYWEDYHPFGLWKPKVVFTIHNMNYGKAKLSQAAYYSQKFTTVSPTYAFEVGGNPTISSQTHKFMGIRNGIDPDLWDPENNQWLPMPYTSKNVVEGKAAARRALRRQLGLTEWGDKFIVGVVSRLTGQKGVPLIKHAAYRAVERGGQFVLLGSAPDPKVQAEFNALAGSYSHEVAAFCFKYDEPLSHLIYAACDMIVVPSMFEPCGLTQMIAMRYGAVPIVRHTGGLKDTVFDVDFDKARAAWEIYGSSDPQRDGLEATNGFAFDGVDAGSLDYAMNRAIDAWYNDRKWFHQLQKRVMEQDWSWNRPALDYIELYNAAKKS